MNTGAPMSPWHPEIGNPVDDDMTLRDYFAAKAMQANDNAFGHNYELLAKQSYLLADYMLKAREMTFEELCKDQE